MKRKLTLFLSAVMAASCLPMTAYAANFKDISDVPWAATVINNVADRGLLSGYEDNTFRGKNNVTYCEAMQMAYTTLTKSGAVEPIDAVTAYSYMGVLDTYKVPKWSQMAVAYGLSEGIIDMQMVVSKFAGGKTAATREDVAIIFGNAMAPLFGKERDTTAAKTFVDYWSISVNALEQVDILKRLGIIGGDNYGRFNPKNNITRAEMAVILSNTYDKVADGVAEKGELIEVVKNGDNYYFRMERENGGTEGFHATEGTIPVYVGYTTEKVSMSKLIE
ncbi:MAG: S-layer homology domain-containing protein, partial [Anaerotignum sp.]|nr:S-layer homology domain-containing protein [Anaerotignum sp.]